MKLSRLSTKGRQLARETAAEILNVVGSNEAAFEVIQHNAEAARTGGAMIKQEGASIRAVE
jgi:hypothetical protein